jgi:phosphoenolpyruvate-protein kinase (PTS system EI component)
LNIAAIKIDGQDPQAHPVAKELQRMQQCFKKIQAFETASPRTQTTTVNTEATARILKHELASGDEVLKAKFDEQIARERANAVLVSMRSLDDPIRDAFRYS